MKVQYLSRYFMERCKALKTFEIDSWLDNDGYPHNGRKGYIKSIVHIENEVVQSLYMAAGKTIYMGLLDCDPGIGNDEVELDIEFHFDSSELTLNYNNITMQQSEYYDWDFEEKDNLQLCIEFSPSEELHFQDSLIEDKYFTYEEEQMMLKFFNEIRKRFFENKVPIKCKN